MRSFKQFLKELFESESVKCKAYSLYIEATAAAYNHPDVSDDLDLKADDVTVAGPDLAEVNERLAAALKRPHVIRDAAVAGVYLLSVKLKEVTFDVVQAIYDAQDMDEDEDIQDYDDVRNVSGVDIGYSMVVDVVLGPDVDTLTEGAEQMIGDLVGGMLWGQYADSGAGFNVEWEEGHNVSSKLSLSWTDYAMVLATGEIKPFNKEQFLHALLKHYKEHQGAAKPLLRAAIRAARTAGIDLEEFKSIEKSLG